MFEPFIPELGGESELYCAPLTPAQLAARDAAWPEYAEPETCVAIRFDQPGWPIEEKARCHGSLMGDIRAKMAVAGQTALASRYGLHLCAPDDLAQFMAECRAFLGELEARNEF